MKLYSDDLMRFVLSREGVDCVALLNQYSTNKDEHDMRIVCAEYLVKLQEKSIKQCSGIWEQT